MKTIFQFLIGQRGKPSAPRKILNYRTDPFTNYRTDPFTDPFVSAVGSDQMSGRANRPGEPESLFTTNYANGANGKGAESSSLAMGYWAVYIVDGGQFQFCSAADGIG